MTDAQKLMAKYKASNDAYNEMRHLANDCRIAGMPEEAAQLCTDAEPYKMLADNIYKQIMGEHA
tara:strand:+ start:345 stop:536 length:192 start_codon:yes stop_codon:yes gene_type:complete